MSHGSGAPRVRSWDQPACPDCDSDVFVDAVSYDAGEYRCQACATAFRAEVA